MDIKAVFNLAGVPARQGYHHCSTGHMTIMENNTVGAINLQKYINQVCGSR
jgi:hypothetical protein